MDRRDTDDGQRPIRRLNGAAMNRRPERGRNHGSALRWATYESTRAVCAWTPNCQQPGRRIRLVRHPGHRAHGVDEPGSNRPPYKAPAIDDLTPHGDKLVPELSQPELTQQLFEAVSGLAAEVKELKKARVSMKPPEDEGRRLCVRSAAGRWSGGRSAAE